MANYHYSLGPWVWQGGDEPGWHPPASAVACVDLRGLPAQAMAGTYGDRPFGFFATSDPLDDAYAALGSGDCREIQVTGLLRDTWESLLGYRADGAFLVDLLWDQLTQGSDPSGDTPTSPLMPTVRGALELHLAGHSVVKRERFKWGEHPHTAKVRDVLHRDYRRIVAEVARGRGRKDHDRRVLDFWAEQYRLDGDAWKELVPQELRKGHKGRLPHETTLTESWPTNGTTISSGQDNVWTETSGDLEVRGGRLGEVGENNYAEARLEADLSSADHYSQCAVYDLTGGLDEARVSTRFDSGARTHYGYTREDAARILIKRVAGTPTTLTSAAASLPSDGTLIKNDASGSTISAYDAGVSVLSLTDTSITGNLRCGAACRENGEQDAFACGDLSIQSLAPHYLHYARLRKVR